MPGFDFSPGLPSSYELDYVPRTTDLTVTATAAASAQTWIDGNAVIYDGSTRVKVEAFSAAWDGGGTGANVGLLELYDGSTDLGVLAQVAGTGVMYGVYFVTPSAGSHTYHVKAWKSGSGSIRAASGTYVPAWYRITKR